MSEAQPEATPVEPTPVEARQPSSEAVVEAPVVVEDAPSNFEAEVRKLVDRIEGGHKLGDFDLGVAIDRVKSLFTPDPAPEAVVAEAEVAPDAPAA